MSGPSIPASPQPFWQYLRLEIPIWLWTLAEVSLLVPLSYALMPWARYWPPVVLTLFIGCLMLIPFNLIRLMSLTGLSLRRQRQILFASLLFVLLLSLRSLLYEPAGLLDLSWMVAVFDHLTAAGYPFWARDLGLIGLVLYGWWRGMTLFERPTSLTWVGLQFRVRALLFAPVIILLASRRLIIDMAPFLLLFGFAQLMVVALARANDVQRQETGLAFHFQPRWLLVVSGAALIVVAAAGFIGYAVGSSGVGNPPQEAVLLGLTVIFFTLAYLLAPILFPLLEWLANSLVIALRPLARLISGFQGLPGFQEEPQELVAPEAGGLMAQYAAYLPAIIFLLILIGVIVLIVFLYTQVVLGREGDEGGRPAGRASAAPPDLEKPSLWDRLRKLIPGWRDWQTARSIRRIYYQMVFAATHRGFPRETAETPFEYLATLDRLWPENRVETELITNAYVRVRYGQLPETPADLQVIFDAWLLLEKELLEENGG